MTKTYIDTEAKQWPLYFYDIKRIENIETENQIPAKYKELFDGGYDKDFDPKIHYFDLTIPAPVDGKWTFYKTVKFKLPPTKVTARQARRALLEVGLLDAVDAAIDSITDETVKKRIRIDWEYATEIERNSEFVTLITEKLGMTTEQVEGLFVLANTL